MRNCSLPTWDSTFDMFRAFPIKAELYLNSKLFTAYQRFWLASGF